MKKTILQELMDARREQERMFREVFEAGRESREMLAELIEQIGRPPEEMEAE